MEKVFCGTQNYPWGYVGPQSLIYRLLYNHTEMLDPGLPYAEMWMGTHKNMPSKMYKGGTLEDFVKEKYNTDLPFLFKVLSIKKPLSIQTHPDKETAERLHKEQPNIYKDPNHKPEIAIALGNFSMFYGFVKNEVVVDKLTLTGLINYLEFQDVITIEGVVKALFNMTEDRVKDVNETLIDRLSGIEHRSPHERVILELPRTFSMSDVGITLAYFMNYVSVPRGCCIYIPPNVPHSYIYGDIIECMSCSDNVIRCGLTSKHIDKKTLMDTVRFNYMDPNVLIRFKVNNKQHVFEPPVRDFEVHDIELLRNESYNYEFEKPTIVLVLEGAFQSGDQIYKRGEVLITDDLKVDMVITEDIRLFCAKSQ
jgi:mannose-6-phosphate isomerase